MKKRTYTLLGTLLLGVTLASSSSLTSAGDYDNVSTPSIIATAYNDAKTSETTEKKEAANASGEGAKEEKKEAKDATKNLKANTSHLLSGGNFGTVGLLYGPISGNGKVDQYGALTNTASVDASVMKSFGSQTNSGDKINAYHSFGLALTHLREEAKKTQTAVMGVDATVDAFEGITKAFSTFGIEIVKKYNPLPVVASFYDSSFLNDSRFAGSDGNQLIILINRNSSLSQIVRFFGGPVTVGSVTTSMAYFMTGTLAFISLGVAAFARLFNGRRVGITLRRSFLRLGVAAVAIPLIANMGSRLIEFTSSSLSSQATTRSQQILSENLHLYNWYKNTSFALPAGQSLTVKGGQFQWTPELVYAINMNSMDSTISKKTKKANRIRDMYNTSANILIGPTVPLKHTTDGDTLASQLQLAAKINDNRTKISFTESYGYKTAGSSKPWDYSSILLFAESLGSNEEYKPEGEDVTANKYVAVSGLSHSGNGGPTDYTFTQTGSGYGISPIAAYNMMATDFSDNGFTVRTNTEDIYAPTVAISVLPGSIADNKAPSLVKLVMMLSMIGVGVKALMSILSSGFGAVFRGGAGAATGMTESAGTLLGGVFALTIGVLGLSVIMTIALEIVDVMWGLISSLLFSNEMSEALDAATDDILGGFKNIPIVGAFIDGALKSLSTFVMTIVGILLLPQIVKTPVVAYGEWVSGIPLAISERFLAFERAFTGDQFGGGSSIFSLGAGGSRGGGGGSGALQQLKASEQAKRAKKVAGMKQGLAAMASAGAGFAGATWLNSLNKSDSEGDVSDESVTNGDTDSIENDESLALENSQSEQTSEQATQEETGLESSTVEESTSEVPDLTDPPEEGLGETYEGEDFDDPEEPLGGAFEEEVDDYESLDDPVGGDFDDDGLPILTDPPAEDSLVGEASPTTDDTKDHNPETPNSEQPKDGLSGDATPGDTISGDTISGDDISHDDIRSENETPNGEVTPKDSLADKPEQGPKTDTPKDGLPKSDLPKDGLPKDNPKGDTPKDGLSKDGLPKDGLPKSDLPKDGLSKDVPKGTETPKDGLSKDVPKGTETPKDGLSKDVPKGTETPKDGLSKDVPKGTETPKDGLSKDVPKGTETPKDGLSKDAPKGTTPKDGLSKDAPKDGLSKDAPKGTTPKDGLSKDTPKGTTPKDGLSKDTPKGTTPKDGLSKDAPKGTTPKDGLSKDTPKGTTPKDGLSKDTPKGTTPKGTTPKDDGSLKLSGLFTGLSLGQRAAKDAQSPINTRVDNRQTSVDKSKPVVNKTEQTKNPTQSPTRNGQQQAKSPNTSAVQKPQQGSTMKNLQRAAATGLATAGGHTKEQTGKDYAKLAASGALHAAGSVIGVGGITGRVMQSQIDKRNERLVAAGKDIPDNISGIGESREQNRRRMQERVNRTQAAAAVEAEQAYQKEDDKRRTQKAQQATRRQRTAEQESDRQKARPKPKPNASKPRSRFKGE